MDINEQIATMQAARDGAWHECGCDISLNPDRILGPVEPYKDLET